MGKQHRRYKCPNIECLTHKSVHYRKHGTKNDLTCRACGTYLILFESSLIDKRHAIAKSQLKEFEMIK